MTKDEALKLALEALELSHPRFGIGTAIYIKAIAAIKEALAQPEQEPVGQLLENAFGRGQVMWFNKPKDESMLYTTPPQRKPLTDEEIEAMWPLRPTEAIIQFARAIEAAHGIKRLV